jgi:class 3 adenylate cyclase
MASPRRDRARFIPRPLRRFWEQAPELRPLSLRFRDRTIERAFQAAYFRDNLSYVRLAHVLGMALWAVFAVLARFLLDEGGGMADLVLRFGVAIPFILVSLGLTYAPWYPNRWQPILFVVLLVNGMLWSSHRALVSSADADWAFAGLILVFAFNYVLSRVQFLYTAAIGGLLIAYHNVVAIVFTGDTTRELVFSDFFLVAFAAIGMAGAYALERFARLLFIREQELERERQRADDLLENTLPHAIVLRLKEQHANPQTGSIADGLPEVSVVFADLESFAQRAETIAPRELVVVLDDVFRRFDALADRLRMEKIKTVGDAYMAVAGAPDPVPDHASAAAEMALGIQEEMDRLRWPTGEPMRVRIGIASGPVVAGVIGRRKFSYDLWGDTVNLASRLESHGTPGRTLVSEKTADLLGEAYELSRFLTLELKGKGPTRARFLLGRATSATRFTNVGPHGRS